MNLHPDDKKPPFIVEPDRITENTYRIVPLSAIKRYNRCYGTTARPPYAAMVYDEELAYKICRILNEEK